MAEHNLTGKLGEDAASLFLVERGYEILHRNWRMRKLEVDIIARNTTELIFVEVKTRNKNSLIHPLQAVTRDKQLNVMRAAQAYFKIYRPKLDYRFDVLALIKEGDSITVEHYPDAFRPSLGNLRR